MAFILIQQYKDAFHDGQTRNLGMFSGRRCKAKTQSHIDMVFHALQAEFFYYTDDNDFWVSPSFGWVLTLY